MQLPSFLLRGLTLGLACVAVLATPPQLGAQGRDFAPNLLTPIAGQKDPLAASILTIRNQAVIVDVRLLDGIKAGDVVRVELFAGTVFFARFADRTQYGKGHYAWTGTLDGLPLSSFIISVCQGKVDASFSPVDTRYPHALTIQTAPGMQLVRELDQRNMKTATRAIAQAGGAQPQAACDDDPAEVTILVVYENVALANAGSVSGLTAAITTRMTELNTTMTNSLLPLRFKLATSPKAVNYNTAAMQNDLSRLRLRDGIIDQVHTWRDQYRADLVAMVVGAGPHGNIIGIAYVPTSAPPRETVGFSVSRWNSPLTFAHEICHNFGCQPDPGNSLPNKIYPFCHGHRFGVPLFGFSTLMAYPDIWNPTRVQMLSSPNLTYGVWIPGTATADNRQVVDLSRQSIANFRRTNRKPAISTQPVSVSRCLGYQTSSTIMTVATTGAPRYPTTYQWYRNGSPVSGQTSVSLVLRDLTPASAGSYRCRASNACGSVDSNAANLTILTTCNTRRWTGRVNGYGNRVSRAGDFNRDGYEDVIIGDYSSNVAGSLSGSVEVFSGKDGSRLFSKSYAAGEQLGFSIAAAGDVDQDGYGDIIVGAPGYATSRGYARVFSGRTQTELWLLTGAASPNASFGASVCGAGDTDGDGYPDLLVGASGSDTAYLFSGKTGQLIRTHSWAPGDRYGRCVAAAGDIDRDGYADVIVGAPNYDSSKGFAQVFSGKTGHLIHSVFGTRTGGSFGFSIVSIGDVNEDSVPDFAIGAPTATAKGTQSGEVTVFSGKDKSPLYSVAYSAGETFGYALAAAGDINGDDFPDFYASAPNWGSDRGYVRTLSGNTGSQLAIVFGTSNSLHGADISGIDANGDATPDLLVGSPRTGTVWLYDAAIAQDPPAIEVFGAACEGSNGKLPHILFGGRAAVGKTFSADLYAGASNVTALFMIDAVRSQLSLSIVGAPNCVVSALPTLSSQYLTKADGSATVDLTIPNQASLIGTQAFTQWLLLDMPANAGGLVTSNAARIQFGRQ